MDKQTPSLPSSRSIARAPVAPDRSRASLDRTHIAPRATSNATRTRVVRRECIFLFFVVPYFHARSIRDRTLNAIGIALARARCDSRNARMRSRMAWKCDSWGDRHARRLGECNEMFMRSRAREFESGARRGDDGGGNEERGVKARARDARIGARARSRRARESGARARANGRTRIREIEGRKGLSLR